VATGVVDSLVEAGRRVFAPDARGHGESAKPHDPGAYANDAMVRDIQSLMDYASLEPVDVVGYSMGAIVAGRLAPRDPRVRSLVLGGVGGEWAATSDHWARSPLPTRWRPRVRTILRAARRGLSAVRRQHRRRPVRAGGPHEVA